MLRTPVLPDTVIEIYIYIYIYIPIWIGRIELVSCTVYSSTCHVVVSRMERSKWNAPPWLGGPKMQMYRSECINCIYCIIQLYNARYTEISLAHIRNASDTRSKYTPLPQFPETALWLLKLPIIFWPTGAGFCISTIFQMDSTLFLLNCCWPQKSARAPHPGLSFGWLLSGEMGCPACFKGVSGEAKRERYTGGHLEILLWVHTMTRFQLNIILCFAFDCWWLFLVTFVEKDIVAALDQTAPWTQGVKLPCSVSKYELGFRISTNQRWAELSRKYAKTNGAWEGKKPQGLGGKICKIRILEPYPKWILWMK